MDYTTQRTESMMAFFLLLTLYAAIRATRRAAWMAIVLACLAGTMCKETIAVAPLLVALHDRVFLYPLVARGGAARASLYLGLAASWLVLAGLVMSGPRAAVSGLRFGRVGVDVPAEPGRRSSWTTSGSRCGRRTSSSSTAGPRC